VRSTPASYAFGPMALTLTTAGESHGPALVGIITGLPASLALERQAIEDDLRRRQEGYGRSPRQRIETDTVEVLAGLRHGRTLGTPLALLIRNRDHENWAWGMSAWPPLGEPRGKGTKPVTLPRPGHADLAGTLKFGHADVRDTLERASARGTAITVAAGAVAKALLAELGISVSSTVVEIGDEADEERRRNAVTEARADRDTLGGIVQARATGMFPGLGSYATSTERLDGRIAGALMSIQAVKGIEIGDGFALAGRRGSEAHDEIVPGLGRLTNRAGGLEGGVTNGEDVVVRLAMKPLPTLMRPLRSVDLETGKPAEALVERSDVAAVEALAVVAEAVLAWELARAACEKFGGDSLDDLLAAHRAYRERIPWQPR
jgi:chorismate synthase